MNHLGRGMCHCCQFEGACNEDPLAPCGDGSRCRGWISSCGDFNPPQYPPASQKSFDLKYCFKVGLAVGVTVCLLRRKKMAKKEKEVDEVEMAKKGEEGATEADVGNFERISLA